ncbi:hypothetical protein BC332_03509 [Capsicum chinense]|nr:hypothetical protein BC332_03509 [Capsicum chinense]
MDYSSIITDFTTSSECSACKCQDCKAKHDGVINAINALISSTDKMISKRGVIPSKKISYPDTPLEIKAAKRRRKDTSKALSSIKKQDFNASVFVLHRYESYVATNGSSIQNYRTALIYLFEFITTDNPSDVDVIVEATTEEHNIIVDNPSIASKEEEKVEPSEVFQNEECLINIIKGFSIQADLPWYLVDEVYISINCGDEFHWVLAVVVLKEKRIRVYDSMSRRRCFGPLSEIQKLAKILLTYLDMSGFGKKGIVVLLLPPTPSICAMDYKYQIMDLMPDYSAKDLLLFYGNTEKRKLKIHTQLMLKIHDDQGQIS